MSEPVARWRKTKTGRWCAVLRLEDAPNVGERISIANWEGEVTSRIVSSYGAPFMRGEDELVYAYLRFEAVEEE